MTKRILVNIAQVLTALAILGILVFLAYRGSDLLVLLFSLALIVVAVLMVIYVRRAVVRGELP